MSRFLTTLSLVAGLSLISAFISQTALADAQADLVTRGEYVTHAADCAACHTAPGGRPFAGGRAFELPFGTLYSPNITPDTETGIAGTSDDEWVRTLREGVARGGKHLYPAMPYASYTKMSRDDALAVKAYLLSLAPIHAPAQKNRISFPFNQRWAMFFWNLFNNSDQRLLPDSTKTASYNRGAYLVDALGHCGECHTPRNLMMGLNESRKFAGATQVGWVAYNLTSDRKSGIGNWTDQDLESYLTRGYANGHGPASGPMAEVVEDSLQYLTPEDIHAMVTYLRGVTAQESTSEVPIESEDHKSLDTRGSRLFADACAGCHLPSGGGRQSNWAALAGAHTVTDVNGTNLVAVLTQGTRIETEQGDMFMHPFNRAYTNDEMAALANYTRAQFGSQGVALGPARFKKQRLEQPDTQAQPAF